MHLSTKTYGHDHGLSAVFRQHKAQSHCQFLHGYSLGFKFTFAAHHLDARGWVVDFGGLGELKKWLQNTFDHKLCVAGDDPKREELLALTSTGLAQVTLMKGVGAEAFAEQAWECAQSLVGPRSNHRCWCVSAECFEHGANSAIYIHEREQG